MNYDYARAMVDHLGIIRKDLNVAIILAQSKADPEEYESIKKSLGMTIAKLEMEVLGPIYRAFPGLDPTDAPVAPTAT